MYSKPLARAVKTRLLQHVAAAARLASRWPLSLPLRSFSLIAIVF